MKKNPDDVYQKVKHLAENVKIQLQKQGVAIPSKAEDGTIIVGRYKIKKSKTGFYSILNYCNDVVVDYINLPQSAALLANKLALGKYMDDSILIADRSYGHALFEEELHKMLGEKSIKSKNIDRAEIMFTKCNIAKHKREQQKKIIINDFEKLLRFR
jgi:hypothetical protein